MRNFLLLLLLFTTPALCADIATGAGGYAARYDLLRNGKVEGIADVTVTPQADGRWEMRNATRGTKGLPALVGFRIDERSLIQWRDGTPSTLGYQYLQKTAFKTKERALTVDPAGGHIVSRDGKKEYVLDYRADVLDRQSVSLALANDIAHGASGLREYSVADREAVGTQRYNIGARERIVTGAGEFDAVRVERIRENKRGRETRTWFAVTEQPFMLRLRQTEPNGDRIEMRLTTYQRK